MKVYETQLRSGITRSKEFERKRLAPFAANVGTKCGHGCLYCSSGSLLRMHRSFADVGLSPFSTGYAIVDPTTPERIARDAKRRRKRGMVQLCTTVDAWSPEAQEYNLGRRCLEAILSQPGWTVRILTKSSAVAQEFDLIEKHRDRVLVGLSITAMPDKGDIISITEPHASPIDERMEVLQEAHTRGLRTYAMFCPLLPAIGNRPDQIDQLVCFAAERGAEEIFSEPVNLRGRGLGMTQKALAERGYHQEATAVEQIRSKAEWSRYVAELISNVQRSVRAYYEIERLRVLLYPSRLTPEDAARIRQDDSGVVWLEGGRPLEAEAVAGAPAHMQHTLLDDKDGADSC